MPAIIGDLDDVESLLSADHDGLLRSAAMAGAQVRSVAQAQAEGVLEPLAQVRPRAVVIVTGSSILAARAAALVVAVLAARADVPLVVTPSLPGWTGPLDVVVVSGQDAGDPPLSDAITRALRRHAEVAVLAPIEGPLREAVESGGRAGRDVIDLSPRLYVDPRFGYPGLVAGLLAVLTALTQVRLSPAPPELGGLADQLDAEAAADHPQQDSFTNQAKLLAQRIAGRQCVWAGDSPGTTAVAAQAAACLFAVAGIPATVADEAGAIARLAAAPGDRAASIFYDPDFDEAPPPAGSRLLLVTTTARAWHAQQRIGALPDAGLVTAGVVDPESVPVVPAGPDELFGDAPADLAGHLLITVRAGLAAAYLALLGEPGHEVGE